MNQIKPIANPVVGVEINDKFEGNLSWNFKLKDFLQHEAHNNSNLQVVVEEKGFCSEVIHAGEYNGKKIAWVACLGGVSGLDEKEDDNEKSHLALALACEPNCACSRDSDSDSDDSGFNDSDKITAKIKITIDEVLIGDGDSDGTTAGQLQKQHILETEHEFSINDPYFIFLFKKYPNISSPIKNKNPENIVESAAGAEQLQLEFRCKIKLHFNGQNFKCEKEKCIADQMRNIEASSTEQFSDFDIKVNETVFKKHKLILGRTPYFRRLFETDMVESAESLMEIPDFTPQIVSKMLDYLYTGQIVSSTIGADDDVDGQDLELHRIADKYGILDLKEELESKIAKNIQIENACQIFKYADAIGSKDLKENAIKFIINNRIGVTKTEGFNELKNTPDLLIELLMQTNL